MSEVSPQNEREVVEQSAATDSMPNQRSSGVKKWLRTKLENLGMLPLKKESNVTEHLKIGRSLTEEEIYNIDPRKDADAEAQKNKNT